MVSVSTGKSLIQDEDENYKTVFQLILFIISGDIIN